MILTDLLISIEEGRVPRQYRRLLIHLVKENKELLIAVRLAELSRIEGVGLTDDAAFGMVADEAGCSITSVHRYWKQYKDHALQIASLLSDSASRSANPPVLKSNH